LGAVSFAVVALTRGEHVNAAWLVVAAVCIYLIASNNAEGFLRSPPFSTTSNTGAASRRNVTYGGRECRLDVISRIRLWM
jgi:hypothetical protein